jgi:hypothetical protein
LDRLQEYSIDGFAVGKMCKTYFDRARHWKSTPILLSVRLTRPALHFSGRHFYGEGVRQKNKCGLGQPPKPHCYRGPSELPSFAEAKDHRATSLRRAPRSDDEPEARAPGLRFSVSIPLFRGTSEEAAKPGHQRTGHAPIFPPMIHSRETTGNAESLSQQIQNISRFD